MVCKVHEVPSCPLAHCTLFPAVLSAPSFAWHCLTMWFLSCLAPDSALIQSGLSICDHRGDPIVPIALCPIVPIAAFDSSDSDGACDRSGWCPIVPIAVR